MAIRTFQPGDEEHQVRIYNEAAKNLPKFKPATVMEVRRRTSVHGFDPTMRLFAEENGTPVGYCLFNSDGRVCYPWCLPGFEAHADELFARVLSEMKPRGFRNIYVAYRGDWPQIGEFFQKRGFRQVREMVNFIIDLIDMPTPMARPSNAIRRLQREHIPELLKLMPGVLAVDSEQQLEKHFFENPYFSADSAFVLRNPSDQKLVAVGLLIVDPTYADPKSVDPMAPCFRLGAFGAEGRNTKRINGLFSFLVRNDANVNAVGLDLMGQAAYRLRQEDELESLAAQAPSDAPTLLGFYQRHFDRQGSFPIFEYKWSTD